MEQATSVLVVRTHACHMHARWPDVTRDMYTVAREERSELHAVV